MYYLFILYVALSLQGLLVTGFLCLTKISSSNRDKIFPSEPEPSLKAKPP